MPICVVEDPWAEYGYGCELSWWWSPGGDPSNTDIADDFLYGAPSILNFSTNATICALDSMNLSRDRRSTVDKHTVNKSRTKYTIIFSIILCNL